MSVTITLKDWYSEYSIVHDKTILHMRILVNGRPYFYNFEVGLFESFTAEREVVLEKYRSLVREINKAYKEQFDELTNRFLEVK